MSVVSSCLEWASWPAAAGYSLILLFLSLSVPRPVSGSSCGLHRLSLSLLMTSSELNEHSSSYVFENLLLMYLRTPFYRFYHYILSDLFFLSLSLSPLFFSSVSTLYLCLHLLICLSVHIWYWLQTSIIMNFIVMWYMRLCDGGSRIERVISHDNALLDDVLLCMKLFPKQIYWEKVIV